MKFETISLSYLDLFHLILFFIINFEFKKDKSYRSQGMILLASKLLGSKTMIFILNVNRTFKTQASMDANFICILSFEVGFMTIITWNQSFYSINFK
jgi:hypothetical protein